MVPFLDLQLPHVSPLVSGVALYRWASPPPSRVSSRAAAICGSWRLVSRAPA